MKNTRPFTAVILTTAIVLAPVAGAEAAVGKKHAHATAHKVHKTHKAHVKMRLSYVVTHHAGVSHRVTVHAASAHAPVNVLSVLTHLSTLFPKLNISSITIDATGPVVVIQVSAINSGKPLTLQVKLNKNFTIIGITKEASSSQPTSSNWTIGFGGRPGWHHSGHHDPRPVVGPYPPYFPFGPTGVTGVTGPTGISGCIGATGDSGVSGVTGVTGVSGVSGVSGASTIGGPTGVSGAGYTSNDCNGGLWEPSGSTGTVGVTGTTGYIWPYDENGNLDYDGF
jgi:hypothetical protein